MLVAPYRLRRRQEASALLLAGLVLAAVGAVADGPAVTAPAAVFMAAFWGPVAHRTLRRRLERLARTATELAPGVSRATAARVRRVVARNLLVVSGALVAFVALTDPAFAGDGPGGIAAGLALGGAVRAALDARWAACWERRTGRELLVALDADGFSGRLLVAPA